MTQRAVLRSILLALIILVLAPAVLAAQDYSISRTVFIPSVYYVGDRVELRLSLRSSLLDQIQLPQELPPAQLGDHSRYPDH
jgi:hypothetical protein